MTAFRFWQDLATTDFGSLDPETTVAVQPVGAIEQHGPHLPVATDACIAQEMARGGMEKLDGSFPALLLPLSCVGGSDEHLAYPGTLTHSAETLIRNWTEIGDSVRRAGVRKIVFINAHGGQPQIMDIVARDLRVRHGMLAVTCNWWRMGLPEDLVPDREVRHGIHGGTVETSVMLHLRPDLVRMDRAEDFVPAMVEIEGECERLQYLGDVGIAWQAQDIHPAGVAGNAAAATPEIGRAIVDHVTGAFATLVAETSRFPLSRIRRR